MTCASVSATWSKVLWLSLRTTTLHSPPSPLAGPPTRGSSTVCDISQSGYPRIRGRFSPLGEISVQAGVHLLGRRGLRIRLQEVRIRGTIGDFLAQRDDELVQLRLPHPP